MHSVTHSTQTFRNPDGACNLLKQLNQQRLKGIECDLSLNSGDIHRAVHRCVIRATSPVIDQALTVQSGDQQIESYNIDSLSAEALDSFIHYVYTSEITVTPRTALDLHTAAIALEIPYLMQVTMVYLHDCINADTCITLLNHAVTHNCDVLRDECVRYCATHYEEIIDKAEFVQILPTEFLSILSSSNLTICDEQRLFDSVKYWLDADPAAREPYTIKLSENIRYHLFDVTRLLELLQEPQNEQFHDHIRKALIDFGALVKPIAKHKWERKPTEELESPVSPSSATITELTQEILGIKTLTNDELSRSSECNKITDITIENGSKNESTKDNLKAANSSLENDSSTPSLPSTKDDLKAANSSLVEKSSVPSSPPSYILAVFGGRSSEKKLLKDVVCYQFKPEQSQINLQPLAVDNLRVLPNVRKGFGAVDVWNQAFLVGGQPASSLQTVDVYDFHENEWLVGPSLLTGRAWHSVTRSLPLIFAVGGVDKTGAILSDGEMLDVRTGIWQTLPQMNQPRMSLAACVYNNVLYAIGGVKQPTIEALDLRTRKWLSVAKLEDQREAPGIGVFDGKIYIFGGASQTGSLDSTIKFDPCNGHVQNMCPMPVGLAFTAFCNHENKVLAIGGRNTTETSRTIQLYDMAKNDWSVISQSLPNARSSCCAIIMPKV